MDDDVTSLSTVDDSPLVAPDRSRQLASIWAYLPTFRVVAETQHLPTAARILHVSPSALSRTVALLEDALGQRLFERAHRQLRLNRAGDALLCSIRDAMRRVDDGITDLADTVARTRIAGPAPWIRALVLPVTDSLVELVDLPASPLAALAAGDVDLVIAESITPSPDIVIDALGEIEWALCRSPSQTPTAIAVYTDTVVTSPELGVTFRAPRLEAVLDACTSGHASAVLPVYLATERGLRIQRRPDLPTTTLFLARRRTDDADRLADLAAAVSRRAAALLDG